MALWYPDQKALFLHIPKTGGRWLQEASPESGVPCKLLAPRHGIEFRSVTPQFTFTTIREPSTWLQSWYAYVGSERNWQWRRTLRKHWCGQRCLDREPGEISFHDWVVWVYSHSPAYVTRLFEWYAGPYDRVHVSKLEDLAATFPTWILPAIKVPARGCSRNPPEVEPRTRELILYHEQAAYRRWYPERMTVDFKAPSIVPRRPPPPPAPVRRWFC